MLGLGAATAGEIAAIIDTTPVYVGELPSLWVTAGQSVAGVWRIGTRPTLRTLIGMQQSSTGIVDGAALFALFGDEKITGASQSAASLAAWGAKRAQMAAGYAAQGNHLGASAFYYVAANALSSAAVIAASIGIPVSTTAAQINDLVNRAVTERARAIAKATPAAAPPPKKEAPPPAPPKKEAPRPPMQEPKVVAPQPPMPVWPIVLGVGAAVVGIGALVYYGRKTS